MGEMKLSQKALNTVVFSKQLQQSLKILQMNSEDLENYIGEELQDNPFLVANDSSSLEAFSDNPEIMSNYRYEKVSNHSYNFASDSLAQISNDGPSLYEHIKNQINIEFDDSREKLIALKLAESLDDNGYLITPISEFTQSLNVPPTIVRDIIIKLQRLEPTGVFATNLSDCLRIQLVEDGLFDTKYQTLLTNIKLMALGEIEKLCKLCKVNKEQLMGMIGHIKSLNPKPGSLFQTHKARNLIPDIFIQISSKDEIKLSLNSEHLNPLAVNSEYYKNIINSTHSTSDRKFCTDKLQSANWLVKSIKQRAETLQKVTHAIAQEQMEFFKRGIMFLKPLKLADIANKIEMHESSVSRISNKIIGTNFGNFEIKYFFSSSLKSNYTENTYSSSVIKAQIKKLIAEEVDGKVLSDDQIAKTLSDMGVKISRRTVTKYREAMRIEPSNLRKRKQKLSA